MSLVRAKPSIPSQAGDLTPRWLTGQLRRHGGLPTDSRVVGFDLSPVEGGLGVSGELVRVALRYQGDPGSAPASVIAKFPTTNLLNRGMIESLGTYQREIDFYQQLASRVPVRVPRHYGSDYDRRRMTPALKTAGIKLLERLPSPVHVFLTRDVTKFMRATARRYALVIEDMGDGQVFDMVEPPPPEQLKTVLEQLAIVHAHFWGDHALAEFTSTGRAVTDIPMVETNVFRERAVPACVERWPELMGPAEIAMLAEVTDRFAADVARLNRPITLIHGDTRSDNMLFHDDGSVTLLDWAMTSLADPGHDVGYLLSSCVDPDDGRPMARKLTEHYHGALSDQGVEHDLDDLWASVEATCRCEVVLQGLSLVFLQASYGDKQPCDYWMPRSLGCLID